MNVSPQHSIFRFLLAASVAFGCLSWGTGNSLSAAGLIAQQEAEEEQDEDQDDGEGDVVEMALAVPAFGFGGGAVSKKYMQAVKKLDVLLQLDMQIDDMKLICDLNKQSLQKLRVAAKAVAQKQVDKWTKSMDEFQMWGNLGFNAEEDDEEEQVDIDKIDLNKVDPNTLQWLSMDMTGMGSEGPTTEKIWKKAVKSALSDEQLAKLESVQSKRNKKLQEANAEFYSQMYGSQLFLSDEKQKKFHDLIRKTLAEHDPPKSLDMSYNSLMHIGGIDDKDFKDILSETQLKRWKVMLGPYRNAAMWGMEVEEVVEDIEEDNAEADKAETTDGDDG